MSNICRTIETVLFKQADPEKKKQLMRFFKTGPGEYAEGDQFIGVTVPMLRKLIPQYSKLGLEQISELMVSEYHEIRMLGLLILVRSMKKADPDRQSKIFNLYLSKTAYINNWDLVDLSAAEIVGYYLHNNPSDLLFRLARSESIWERRIAIMATFYDIKNQDFDQTLQIAGILLQDKHDLIHKAVGWMLREVGNRDMECEINFLNRHYHNMPRTMLRYAIEKFPEPLRQNYLKGRV